MRYLVLATDYDGTLATDGVVGADTITVLERLKNSGRRLVLVTGRELDDLLRVFPHAELFDHIVAENGAVLYRPADRDLRLLGDPPPEAFARVLRERGVVPLSVGRVIVATWQPNESTVLATIRDLGLELQVVFNKGAVMVLPSGVNKATGLLASLRELSISRHNAVGIGDAENDHAFLGVCECSVAVSNALPTLKDRVDLVTGGARGDGVIELVERLLETDLRELEPVLQRHLVPVGLRDDGQEFLLRRVRVTPPRSERQRHGRKYAEGTLGPDKSFFFRGPEDRLRLRAQNLATFVQLAEGIDDETWMYHLRRGDYSEWIRGAIKDEELASEVAAFEEDQTMTAAESRRAVAEAIGRRYTGPA